MLVRSPRADRLVGVLNILTIDRRKFDEDEIAFLETVAGELAGPGEARRVLAELEEKRQAGDLEATERQVELAGLLERLYRGREKRLVSGVACALPDRLST